MLKMALRGSSNRHGSGRKHRMSTWNHKVPTHNINYSTTGTLYLQWQQASSSYSISTCTLDAPCYHISASNPNHLNTYVDWNEAALMRNWIPRGKKKLNLTYKQWRGFQEDSKCTFPQIDKGFHETKHLLLLLPFSEETSPLFIDKNHTLFSSTPIFMI